MRSLAILVLAGAAFAGFILVTHYRAERLFEREADALDTVLRLARTPGGADREEGGYRFAWVRGDDLPKVLVAHPVVHGEGGVRWFVTPDGEAVYQYDTIVHSARNNRPDVTRLRHYLSRPAEERKDLPFGWQLLP